MSMVPVSTPSSRRAAPTSRSVPSRPWVRSIASPRRLGTYVRAVMPPTTPIGRIYSSEAARPSECARSRSTSGIESTPSIVSESPPTSPITRAAAPNAASDAAGPETTNAPGPSPKRSSRPETVAPRPRGDRALGQRDRDAALGDVVRGADRARADRLADRGVQRLELAELDARERPVDGLAAQLGELRARRCDGAQPAETSAIASPGCDEAEPARAARRPAARRRGRRPASGRSGLRRPRCRARRCRRRPGCRTRGTRRRGRRSRA